MRHPFFTTIAALALAGAASVALLPPACAQGILYPRPEIRTQPFYVKNLRVNTTITDSVAETTVEQTFVNESSVEQEGTYLYPLPEGAAPTSFSMTVGDRTMEPRILSKDEARSIYESIVRRRRDPALLEYVGRNLVRISVFPIPARGERLIRLRYTEILKPENGLRKYAYALSTSRFGSRPVGAAIVNIKLRTSAAIKNVYSPTHDLSVRRTDEREATASWEGTNDASDRDLTLYFSTGDDDVGLSLLSYRSGERDGYFMLLAAPRLSVPRTRILSKQVMFVLDRTGSMAGEKIKQARKSLLFCLNNLRPQDRFNVITFNESSDLLFKRLEVASEANIAKARRFVEDVEASGGTNIDEALRAGLNQLKTEAGSQKMLVFLTDGLPTVGETDVNEILRHVRDLNNGRKFVRDETGNRTILSGVRQEEPGARARLFCFGVGYDVNVPFLDTLAEQGRGDADFVKPEEDIEVKVSSFFAKVTNPILSQLRLAFDGADVYDIYPKDLPDLFKGTQLVITGRFRGRGDGSVRLTGATTGGSESFKLGTRFGEADGRNSFLPRIWAARKIGYLVDQIRLSSKPEAKKEVVEEIVRLSREYGIITEYTSFLVDEREQTALGIRRLDENSRLFSLHDANNSVILQQEVLRRAGQNGVQGEGATNQSQRAKDLGKNDKAASRYQSAGGEVYSLAYGEKDGVMEAKKAGRLNYYRTIPGMGGGGLGGSGRGGIAGGLRVPGRPQADGLTVTLQAINDRAFTLQKNNVWQDHSYDAKKNSLTKIEAFSDAHFALLRTVPSLSAYSSVGDEVIIRIGKNAVQIGKEGKAKLTTAELKELTAK